MAAGLGFKTFTTGEVLTAADVNGYLMQGVLVFASEAARDAAITSPQEGQFAYTKDNNSLWYYSGSAWVASGATGDIEGVTAGVGISGGGTSGTVTITNSMATAIDAKADLIVGTGADTFARLAVGANDTVLTAASGETTGLKWATISGGGYTQLATGSLSGTLITLSSISASYRDLVLVISNATWNTSFAQFAFRYNGNTTADVYKTLLSGAYGTSASAQTTYTWSETNSYNRVYINGEWNYTGGKNHQVLIIKDYATAKYPIIEYQASYENNLGFITFAYGAFTADIQAAINQIDVFMTSNRTFNGGSYTLYGVK
jgi:hypothetical protein